MDTLTSMRVFAKVAELQNFADAARRLDMSPAMVTRHIQFLEQRIGVRLVNRTTRQLSLTEAGALYLESCINLLGDISNTEERISDLGRSPSGRLRISAAPIFGLSEIWPVARDFMREYPEVGVDIVLSNRVVDLIEEDIDVAIRMTGSAVESSLISRRIATSQMLACAAPAYLEKFGTPRSPDELTGHNCLVYINNGVARTTWDFTRGNEMVSVPVGSRMQSNDVRVLTAAALEGEGVVRQPSFNVWSHLANGSLVRILPDWSIGEMAVSIVFPSRRFLPAKTRKFIDCVAALYPPPAHRDIWLERITASAQNGAPVVATVAKPRKRKQL